MNDIIKLSPGLYSFSKDIAGLTKDQIKALAMVVKNETDDEFHTVVALAVKVYGNGEDDVSIEQRRQFRLRQLKIKAGIIQED